MPKRMSVDLGVAGKLLCRDLFASVAGNLAVLVGFDGFFRDEACVGWLPAFVANELYFCYFVV